MQPGLSLRRLACKDLLIFQGDDTELSENMKEPRLSSGIPALQETAVLPLTRPACVVVRFFAYSWQSLKLDGNARISA